MLQKIQPVFDEGFIGYCGTLALDESGFNSSSLVHD